MRKTLLAVALVLILAVGSWTPGVGARAQAAPNSAYVVHGIPGVPVDVYVNDALAIPAFQPLTIAGPVELPGRTRINITIFAAGADPNSASPVIDEDVILHPGGTSSIVAHFDAGGTPTLTSYAETIPFNARRGYGKLIVRHTAALGAVDIFEARSQRGRSRLVFAGLENPQSLELVRRRGTYWIGVAPAGAPASESALRAPFKVTDNTATIVYAVGNPGDGTLTVVTQQLPLA